MMTLKSFILIPLIGAFLCACGAAGGGGTNVSVSDVGNVEGTITDATTSVPVSGVTVQVGDKSNVTGSNGVYSIQDLAVGSRTATATKAGYQNYNGTVTVTKGTTVTQNIQMTLNGVGDTTPPTVSSTDPANNVTAVAVNKAITVTFSEAMDCSTITTSSFTLKDNLNTAVAGNISTCNNTTAVFTQSSNLSYSTLYTAAVSNGVKDAAGNAMASNYSWNLTTETQPTTAPSAPTGVSGTAANKQVTISWTAVTGATSYNIYWSTTTGVTTANGTKITGATSPYIHTSRTNGTTYYYIVTAVNLGGESTASSQTSATPSALMGGSIQGTPLNLTSTNATVTTFAGSAGLAGSTDGAGTASRFNTPCGATTDGTSLFITDGSNHTIRKIVISTGAVTTIAGSAGLIGSTDGTGTAARFNGPADITTDGTNLFVSDTDNNTIRKVVISTGVVTTIAGSAALAGSIDGTGTASRFYAPRGITTDGTNLFVADRGNHTIRKIVISTVAVTTIAGSAGLTGSTDATGTASRFNLPHGITTDGTSLFVADLSNHTIRKVVISTGVVTTVAGSAGLVGSADGIGSTARFNQPGGLTRDGTNLYVSDCWNHIIRKIVLSTGAVSTIAGSAGLNGTTDGTGSVAKFYMPVGITTDGTNLFVCDYWNYTIRKIQSLVGGSVQVRPLNLTNTVTTFVGFAGLTGSTDGTGTAASFNFPRGLTTDGVNLFLADGNNHTIRKIAISTGVVTTLAGSAGLSGSTDGTGTAARFNGPWGITTDGTNLFVADTANHTIRKIVISTGTVTTIAGSAGVIGSSDGTGTTARFNFPQSITTDGTNLFVADTANHTSRKIVISTGVVTTIAGSIGVVGSTDGTGTAASFNNPIGITTDGTDLFVADEFNYTIRKIVISTGVVTTIAGSAGVIGSTDGTGTAARFNNPVGITTDGANLFVTDSGNNTIRKIVISTGVVTTIASSAGLVGSTDGTGTAARFNVPCGIITDGTNLFLVDTYNHTIRKIQ